VLSDDSSWDSEVDGPNSSDSDFDFNDELPRVLEHRHGHRLRYEEEEDEFERDPWNAVCVVGLRVYSKDTDVTIEARNGAGERKKTDGDDSSVISGATTRKEKELDVDDSAADATSPLRTRGNLDSALAERMKTVGSAPAGIERDRSGTFS
jgi:hypothetical protein